MKIPRYYMLVLCVPTVLWMTFCTFFWGFFWETVTASKKTVLCSLLFHETKGIPNFLQQSDIS